MKKAKKIFLSPCFLMFLSAVLSAVPYTFPQAFFLSWVSFAPFFYCLIKYAGATSHRKALLRGLIFGFTYHFAVYYWFLWLYPFDSVGFSKPVAAAVAFAGWFLSAFLHGLLFSLVYFLHSFFYRFVTKNALSGGVFALTLFILAEKAEEFSDLAFPWIRISIGQYRVAPFFQSVSLFGTLGLDAVILFVNLLIALFFICEKRRSFAVAAAGIFSANLIFGAVRLGIGCDTSRVFSVSLIQGNILSGQKWEDRSAEFCLERYVSLTKEASGSADFAVWPESAVPLTLTKGGFLEEEYAALSKETGMSLFIGTLTSNNGVHFNSLILIDENGSSEPYSKRHLVPFGEYLPLRSFFEKYFPAVAEINNFSSDYGSGASTALIDTGKGKAGGAVCFESVFAPLLRESVSDGAEVFVIVTNDSWYKDSPAVYQHLAHAVMRSAENGRCSVRAANTGISAVIDSFGRIKSESLPLEEAIVTDSAYFSDGTTLYSKTGDIIILILAALTFFLAVFSKVHKKREGTPNGRKK